MNIVHLINVRWFNATAWYGLRLVESGIINGDKAAVCGLPDSPVIQKAKELGVNVLEAPFTSNNIVVFFSNLKKIHKFIKEFNADILVCHRGEMFWIIALDKFIFRRKYKLIRVRGDVRPPSTDIFSRFTHNIACDKIITSAQLIKNYFIHNVKSKEKHVDVIYGGVNCDVFYKDEIKREKFRNRFNIKKDDFAVGIIGRYDAVKGHEIFLKACGKAYINGIKNLKVVIAGFQEGISDKQIEDMAKHSGIENITVYTGRVDDIAEVINGCDLGVISSLGSEAICRVAMEFMACSVPVVSSNAGVLPEIIPDEYVYEMYDYEHLAQLIMNKKGFVKLYNQNDFYKQFKEAVTCLL